MLIYHEQDLLQLSKICGITGSFSSNLAKPLNRALKEVSCSYFLSGIRNSSDFQLCEHLFLFKSKHPQTRLIFIYNPTEVSFLSPSDQNKLDHLLDQADIVYHTFFTMQELPIEIAILCQELILLNYQQEKDFLNALNLMNYDDPIIKL